MVVCGSLIVAVVRGVDGVVGSVRMGPEAGRGNDGDPCRGDIV